MAMAFVPFRAHPSVTNHLTADCCRQHSSQCYAAHTQPLLYATNPDRESNQDITNEFDGFNPFQPGSKIQPKSSGIIIGSSPNKETPGGRISPRQMKMKQLTTELLASISDPQSVSTLLESNEGFLLEQLNNLDAVLEPDSVFHPSMNRKERFERYRQVMDERIESARAPAARNVLTLLKEFVLSKE
ncbi:hypothetical protein HJC23_001394 [Cyclotella cryptica]|uniref:Uncharacterized protein n=1 Tax=Cyclotella cryptica TaxID=29204 RepID=A0ABD3P7S9_9STRA|eukprot:CCRYP_016718-RA/>CCRYP_016718-RA protein AED:0.10 eAED:0.10 QI:0/-1/0/1/-1/1/1/0/186